MTLDKKDDRINELARERDYYKAIVEAYNAAIACIIIVIIVYIALMGGL